MCEKVKNSHTPNTRVDKCIEPFIRWLQNKHVTVASCCGHGKYPMTVIVKEGVTIKDKGSVTGRRNIIVYREVISQTVIPRTRNFYKKDVEGYYYIPEVVKIGESVK